MGRFAQADSIIPGAGNPQAWDRYSYVQNNPVRYTDPTGHWEDPGCGSSICADAGSGGGGRHKEKIVYVSPNGDLTVILMPEGIPSNPGATENDDALAQFFATMGIVVEGLELGTYFLGNPAIPIILGIVDVGVTYVSCSYYHECYTGSPIPNLPEMIVVNQDIILTGTEALAPIAGGIIGGLATQGAGIIPGATVTDVVTSIISLGYDIGRLTGEVPNMMSIGVVPESGNVYILLYP